MLGAIAAIASAALSASGAKKQAKAQQQANEQSYELGMENLKYSKERDEADRGLLKEANDRAYAREEMLTKMVTEGYTDPVTGITSKYVPGQGWVTTYSPEAGAQVQGDQREALLRTVMDQAAQRRGRQANELRRNDEGAQAQQTLAEMQGPNPYDKERIIADLVAARRRGVNEGFDKSTSQVLTSNLRTGTASDKFLLDAAKERAAALNDAQAGAYTEGLSLSEDLTGARTSRLGNKYNLFAGRASNVDDVPFAPSELPTVGASLSGKSASSANQNKFSPVTGRSPAQFDTGLVKPNLQSATNSYIAGQSITDLGKTLSNLYKPSPSKTYVEDFAWKNDRNSGTQTY